MHARMYVCMHVCMYVCNTYISMHGATKALLRLCEYSTTYKQLKAACTGSLRPHALAA